MYSLPFTFHNTASHSVSIPFQMELVAGFSSGNVLLPDEPPLPGFCLSLGEIAGVPLPPHLNLSGFLNWPPSDAVFPRRVLNNSGQRQLRLFPDLPAETADKELRKLSGDCHHSGFGIPR